MTSYRITEHNGTYCLMLGNQLIMQATDLAAIKRVKAGLEDRGHAERVLKTTYYDADRNTIRDGIEAR